MLDLLFLSMGLILLVYGGELLLHYSILFARIIRLSVIWISVVIISFGTSAPELIVSMGAAYQNLPDIAIGNVIGSNIANTLLVLGLATVIKPIEIQHKELKLENILLFGLFFLLVGCMFFGQLNIIFGLICIVCLFVYLWYSYHNSVASSLPDDKGIDERKSALKTLGLAIIGLLLLMAGAELLIKGAVGIARLLNISEAVISLSMVALGTSLPELVTSVFAAYKGKNYITLANVIGSNLFNIMVVLGLTAFFFPMTVNPHFMQIDIWVMGATTLVLFLMMVFIKTINRIMGVVLLLSYVIYITYLYIENGAG